MAGACGLSRRGKHPILIEGMSIDERERGLIDWPAAKSWLGVEGVAAAELCSPVQCPRIIAVIESLGIQWRTIMSFEQAQFHCNLAQLAPNPIPSGSGMLFKKNAQM